MRELIIFVIIVFLSNSLCSISFKLNENNSKSASLFYLNGQFIYTEDTYDEEKAICYCKYSATLEENGWDFLALSSNTRNNQNNFDDRIKSYAMGYLEGIITNKRIYNHYLNMKAYNWYDFPNREMPLEVRDYLEKHFIFIEELITSNPNDKYIQTLASVIEQLKGLVDGYNSVCAEHEKLDLIEFHNMAAFGDLEDIPMYSKRLRDILIKKNPSKKDTLDYIDKHSHCSVLFKVMPDLSNIFFGHNTWFSYSSMTRIFKEYRFKGLNDSQSKTVVFSGYPGTLSSIDDFFITDQKLVVTETTNQVFKYDLFDSLTPRSLLTWERSIIANRLSEDSSQWMNFFSRYNSGTYNNQYMILDLKKVDTHNKIIEDNAFWVLEQIPTLIVSKDMTYILRYGYWPSYNVAFFDEIREKSGVNKELIDHPDEKNVIDYSQCARAKIFRRDNQKVINIESYKRLMQYNDYRNDEFGEGRPDFAISARKDMFEDDPQCKGGIDSKLADVNGLFKEDGNMKISIISGPTKDNQIPFTFDDAKCMEQSPGKYLTNGLVRKYEYSWIDYETILFDEK